MEDEKNSTVTNPTEDNLTENYLETIRKLKETTVSKSDFEKVKEENARLLNDYINQNPVEIEPEEKVNVEELVSDLTSGKSLTNLDFVKKSLKLRDTLIKEGKGDIFVPKGTNYAPSDDDYETAEKVASVLNDCVEIADNDPIIFTNELQRRMVESPIAKRR